MINRKLCYLIKWEGYGIKHNSWEPWDGVHALDLIADFHQTHPRAPHQIHFTEFKAIPFRPISLPVVSGCHSLERGGRCQGTPSAITSSHETCQTWRIQLPLCPTSLKRFPSHLDIVHQTRKPVSGLYSVTSM